MMKINGMQKIDFNELKMQKLKKACADFESFFYFEVFKASKSTFKSELLPTSVADDIYKDMFYMEVAKVSAEHSEGGLKDLLFDFLAKGIGENGKKNPYVGKKYSGYEKKGREIVA